MGPMDGPGQRVEASGEEQNAQQVTIFDRGA